MNKMVDQLIVEFKKLKRVRGNIFENFLTFVHLCLTGKKDDKYNSNVLEYLAKYYQVSQREVRDYLEILSKDDITEILLKYGLDKKEIKKWLK